MGLVRTRFQRSSSDLIRRKEEWGYQDDTLTLMYGSELCSPLISVLLGSAEYVETVMGWGG